jgi:tetratricopeptide (TPR) repeat protein
MVKKKIGFFCLAKLTIISVMVFLIFSCSTTTQMYSGPERPSGDTALIRGADASINIVRCDGTKLRTNAATVLPGEHTVEVTYQESGEGYYLLGTIMLMWKAEAGHTYIVDKLIHAAPGRSSMFITDLGTKKDVSTGLLKPGIEQERLRMVELSIKQFPQQADFWAEKGYLLVRLGRYDEATPALETALSIKPDYTDAWAVKSLAFFQQGRYDDSLAANDKVIQLRGNEADKKSREEILKKIEEKKKPQL